ncbi:MAG: type II toxin-antitoxin system RelE/ParE family toxin [Proteobacteria bacterium]|nr:type II toxin-antitoxin system RelE/ParE family toxin [Pseudomonadota bacterium]
MRFSFHPLALEEAVRAASWYRAGGSPRAALNLMANVQSCIELIRRHPDIGTPFVRDTRRLTLESFPYWVVYRIEGDVLRILAIAHQRRRPRYWAKRR